MRLVKFRIQNYKSIIDSGYCTFASDLTILVGKNESGKTATLEALKYFNKETLRVNEDVLSLDGSRREPLVEIYFRLGPEEIESIREAAGVQLAEGAVDYMTQEGVGITKDGRGKYDLHPECVEHLFGSGNTKKPIHYIKSAKEKLHELLDVPHLPNIDYESSDANIQKESKEFIRVVKSFLPSVKDEETQTEVVKAIRMIVKESVKLESSAKTKEEDRQDHKANAVAFFVERFVDHLPGFVFFSEFSDILPFEVPISELKNNQAILDFAKVSGLDLDYFAETQDLQRRINFLNRYSTNISGNFLEYWNQNRIELVVKSEGENLLFGVKEQDKTDFFKVSQRSKGFQWFLSFYLRLNAQKTENSLIIIDEPGMHLHAKAQKEILKVLETEVATSTQIIFSTHCPYLIDSQRLDRIRLVIKDPRRGSWITDDIHNYAGEESMVPVMTAMGGENTAVQPLSGKQNVIVGTINDFYFWKAMQECVEESGFKKINFLPATDVEKIEQLVSLMIGYNLEFQVLFNHNNDGWKVSQQLKEKFGFGDGKIIFVSEKLGYFTEDLFSREDFNEHVLKKESNEDPQILNSVYLKNQSINKVLLAREFFDKIERRKRKIVLSDKTISSFRAVFEKILSRFHILTEVVEETALVEETKTEEKKELPKENVKRRGLFAFLKKA